MQPYIRHSRSSLHPYYSDPRDDDRDAWQEMIWQLVTAPSASANVRTRRFSTTATQE